MCAEIDSDRPAPDRTASATRGLDGPRDYLRAQDELASTAPLAFVNEFPFLGLRLRVRSNARAAIDLAAQSFSMWRALDPALIDPNEASAIELRVIVHDDPASAAREPARALDAHLGSDVQPGPGSGPTSTDVIYRRHGPVLMAAGSFLLLSVHLDQRLCMAFVTPAAFARPDWYRWHVHGLPRFAASAIDRHPFHAATILIDDTAVLITGPSGSGKSTLAYACARRGLPLLSEEVTHIATRDGHVRLWGHAGHVTLGPDAERFFPEVAACPVRRLPSGKHKRECPIAQGDAQVPGPLTDSRPTAPLTHRGPMAICVLHPHVAHMHERGATTITKLSNVEQASLLESAPEPGFDQFPNSHARVQQALRGTPAWGLSVGADLDAAVGQLVALVRSR